MSALQLHTRTHGGGCTVEAIGPITHHTTAILREHLRRILDDPPGPALDLDLRCCTDVDTAGLLALDVAQQTAGRKGATLRLTRVPPLVERLVRQRNLAHLLGPDDDDGRADDAASTWPAGQDP